MKATDEQKALKMWKQFFDGLTVEWMIENNDGVKDTEYSVYFTRGELRVYCYLFEITWGDKVYTFSSPDHLGADDLLSVEEDRVLFKYIPVDVMTDFIRVLEL